MPATRYQFGDYILDPQGMLSGPRGELILRPQAFRLLLALVSNPQRVLSHDELIDQAWGVEHLSASALKQTISEVRKALDDPPTDPVFVQTVPRRGYRFLPDVNLVQATATDATPEGTSSSTAPALSDESPGSPATGSPVESQRNRLPPAQLKPRSAPKKVWVAAAILGFVFITLYVLLKLGSGGVVQDSIATETSTGAQDDGRNVLGAGPNTGPSQRPIAVVLGFSTSDAQSAEVAAQLVPLVSRALTGSGTEQLVPFQVVERARHRLQSGDVNAATLRDIADMLTVSMIVAGSLRADSEAEVTAQIAIFDGRTGRVGAYSRIDSHPSNDLDTLGNRLIDELWEWNGEVHESAAGTQLDQVDLSNLHLSRNTSTGIVVRKLRDTMSLHANSGGLRPPSPVVGE